MLKRIGFVLPLLVAAFVQPGGASAGGDSELSRTGRATLGGMQYWTDHLVCSGWRIQRNVRFGQFRLLKPNNRVSQTGTYDACRAAFDAIRQDSTLEAIPTTVLVTLHGLGRTRNSMSSIGSYVSQQGDMGWINFGYASTRAPLDENVRALRDTLDALVELKREQDSKLDSIDSSRRGIEFHLIGHSLGNILIRRLLHEFELPDSDWGHAGQRVGRIVMLGPPNQGSALANLLHENPAFRLLAGSSGDHLGAKWSELTERLATPKCPFAIIAGGRGDGQGYNPLLTGDDDLIVRVEETKLAGAADFAVVPSIHTYLMNRHETKQMALRFIQDGCLKSSSERSSSP